MGRLWDVYGMFARRSWNVRGTFVSQMRNKRGRANLISTKHALNSSRAARALAPKMLNKQTRRPLQLQPNEPPGHRSRKARSFELQIVQLRQQGYSLDAIRAALAEAGTAVSRSTVHREATRRRVGHSGQANSADVKVSQPPLTAPQLAPQLAPQQAPSPLTPSAHHHAASAPKTAPDAQTPGTTRIGSGRDIADRFMAGRITNSLVLARMNK